MTGERQKSEAVQATRSIARLSRFLELSSADLNLAHYRVLSAVAEGDQRATRVADRLALGKPTVSAAVDSLCRRGLLSRADVAGDRRAATLSLTTTGEATLAEVEREMLDRLLRLAERTPEGPRVLESLARLGAALDELAAERAARRLAGGEGRAS